MGCSPPGSSVHGISRPRDQTRVTCIAGRFFYCLSHQGNPTISKVSLNFLAPWRTETEGTRITPLCWCPYQCDEGGYTLLYIHSVLGTTLGTFVSMISLTSHYYYCLHFTKGQMEVKSLSWLAQGPPAIWLQKSPVLAWASFLPRFFLLNDLSTPTPPIILPSFFSSNSSTHHRTSDHHQLFPEFGHILFCECLSKLLNLCHSIASPSHIPAFSSWSH